MIVIVRCEMAKQSHLEIVLQVALGFHARLRILLKPSRKQNSGLRIQNALLHKRKGYFCSDS